MVQSLVTTECSISFEIAQQGKVFKEQDVLEEDIIERYMRNRDVMICKLYMYIIYVCYAPM